MTSKPRLRPDFIGLGAQRSGTAWLYNCLDEHPALCLPEKEVNYFVHDDKFRRGSEWYIARFKSCGADQLAGEMSSLYLHHPDAPRRIHDHNPDVRLIVSLREPVDRAYSGYVNQISAGELPPDIPFERAVDEFPDILQKSRYADALERFLDVFPRERLLILIYDEGLEDPEAFVQGIYRFLDVDDAFVPKMAHVQINVGRVARSVWADRSLDTAGAVLRKLRLQGPLRWLKKSGVVGALRSANAEADPAPMSDATRRRLREHFAPDVARVADIIGRPLEAWPAYPVRSDGA